MKKHEVYLDYSAGTPVDSVAFKKMLPYFSEKYGNPSSIHKFGQDGRKAVETARQQIADFLGCSNKEIVFTSGATESNAWAIKSALKLFSGNNQKPHIIISPFEHQSNFETAKELKNQGFELTILSISKNGIVSLDDIKKSIKKNTVLVSVIYASNEIGSIQPIKEISKIIKKINNKIIFHTDAVQAINFLDCNVDKLGIDLLPIDGHKIYGPKGVGALYIRSGINLKPLICHGTQEFGLRSGTENVPGIVGLGEAIKRIKINKKNNQKILKLRNKLIKEILQIIPGSKLNGSLQNRLPNNANFSFAGVEGESILMALSQKGVYISTGSACASRSLEPSHILLGIGLSHQEAHSSIRFTLGRQTTTKEINYVLKILPDIIKKLRKISGR